MEEGFGYAFRVKSVGYSLVKNKTMSTISFKNYYYKLREFISSLKYNPRQAPIIYTVFTFVRVCTNLYTSCYIQAPKNKYL